ncbi:Hypothetical protein SRAE_X000009000 [Strongyloides ratti]|uniref:Uncharacterized protein n=1 Tax=Strongyloides ratti TaxID=34506 RepID=A0A090LT44_STRRB|nr:Hypothetical protein SRAE_X000009000 [Strongyloides ratti]CEF70759.1 Hypothetical protein SRAE_X000009000 [Strongyloides ratti]
MTNEEKKVLRERWNDMTSFMNETVKEKWWDKIIQQYSNRPFYNLSHLHNMLQLFDQHKDRLHDRYAVAFAIFFKHLEYDSKSTESAKASADEFKKFSPEKYDIYKSQLRQEYSYLSDDQYKKERLKVLKLFLQIPNIFATKEFRDKYEEKARKNISEEIKSIGE